MDFWTVFNWLWGGTNYHAFIWPTLDEWVILISIGFTEFTFYRLTIWWITKWYGSPHGFWHFVALPVIHNVQADSPEGIKLLKVQDRYTRHVQQTRQRA